MAQLAPMFEGLAEVDGELDDEDRAVVDRFLLGVINAVRRLT